jgi:hypothetical protein
LDGLCGFLSGAACDVDLAVLLVENSGELEAYAGVATRDDENLGRLMLFLDLAGRNILCRIGRGIHFL